MTIPQVNGYGNYLYPYQTYSIPQFNNWNNYGYSTPVFRGTEYQPIMQQPLKQDTVQISAEKEIKINKKEGLSTGAKWAIGLATTAAAAYGCVVGHRMLTKPSIEKVAKNFSETFRKDISKEEAQKLAGRYKEILNIEDTEEFVNTLFKQVKKDYGYEKADIPLKINYMTGKESLKECMRGRAGGFDGAGCDMVIDLPILKGKKLSKVAKKDVLTTLFHEFRHTQQTEMCYRTNLQKYLEALEKNATKDAGNIDKEIQRYRDILASKSELTKYANDVNSTVDKVKEQVEKMIKILEKRDATALELAGGRSFDKTMTANNLNRCFNGVEPTADISKYSDEIQKFMENSANYLRGEEVGLKAYKAQPLESDAFGVGDKAESLYNYISSIWNRWL